MYIYIYTIKSTENDLQEFWGRDLIPTLLWYNLQHIGMVKEKSYIHILYVVLDIIFYIRIIA